MGRKESKSDSIKRILEFLKTRGLNTFVDSWNVGKLLYSSDGEYRFRIDRRESGVEKKPSMLRVIVLPSYASAKKEYLDMVSGFQTLEDESIDVIKDIVLVDVPDFVSWLLIRSDMPDDRYRTADSLGKGRLPELGLRMCSALEAMEAAGFSYGTVSPENVLVGKNKCVLTVRNAMDYTRGTSGGAAGGFDMISGVINTGGEQGCAEAAAVGDLLSRCGGGGYGAKAAGTRKGGLKLGGVISKAVSGGYGSLPELAGDLEELEKKRKKQILPVLATFFRGFYKTPWKLAAVAGSAAVIILAAVVLSVLSSKTGKEVFEYGDYLYRTNSLATVEIAGYKGSDQTVAVPEKLGGKKVTAIGDEAFMYADGVTLVELPRNVKKIGENAFRYCSDLEGIVFSKKLRSIGEGAFSYCESLDRISLPKKVKYIGNKAFYACDSLEAIEVDPKNRYFTSDNDTLFDKKRTRLICCPEKYNGSYLVPATVTEICDNAFNGCVGLTSVVVGENVERVGERVFENCEELREIIFNNRLEEIGSFAFGECKSLLNIDIPASVKLIDTSAFFGCDNLRTVNIVPGNTSYISDNGIVYNSDKTELVFVPKGMSGACVVPNGVQKIQNDAFYFCDDLTSVSLPASLTEIGDYAFYGCGDMLEINIPDSVVLIGRSAFGWCGSLTAVEIASANIGSEAFRGCSSLYRAELGDDIEYIGYMAFCDCPKLEEMTLPAGLRIIGSLEFEAVSEEEAEEKNSGFLGLFGGSKKSEEPDVAALRIAEWQEKDAELIEEGYINTEIIDVFDGCDGMDNIFVSEENPYFTSVDGLWFSKDLTVLYRCPAKRMGVIELPAETEEIFGHAFINCDGIKTVSLGDRLRRIGFEAFKKCMSIKDIDLPAGLEGIDYGAFSECTGLRSVTVPGSVELIGGAAFCQCSMLDGLKIENGVKAIGFMAFYECKRLAGVDIPESVEYIAEQAFESCISLEKLTVAAGNACYTAEDNILYDKDKTEAVRAASRREGRITVPASVKSIANYAFTDCNKVTQIIVPEGVERIGDCAFAGCTDAKSIDIPDSVVYIGDNAFMYCEALTDIDLPSGLERLGDSAFAGCRKLSKISVGKDNVSYSSDNGAICSVNGDNKTLISVPRDRTGRYDVPEGVTAIAPEAFADCARITEIRIPDTVKTIGDGAFENCVKLEALTLPAGVERIGERTAYNCTALKSVDLSASGIKLIPRFAFMGCEALESVLMPDCVSGIGESAFSGCKKLAKIALPADILSIGKEAFAGCGELGDVRFPEGLLHIASMAFSGCGKMENAALPASLMSVEMDSFTGCEKLKTFSVSKDNEYYQTKDNVLFNKQLTKLIMYGTPGIKLSKYEVPDGVLIIGSDAFREAEEIKKIIMPDSVISISSGAFYWMKKTSAVELSERLEYIGDYAFYNNSSLSSIVIPESVKVIGDGAFEYCSRIKKVEIPDSVEFLGEGVFLNGYDSQLSEIKVSDDNKFYRSEDGVLYSKDMKTLICVPANYSYDKGAYAIPEGVRIVNTYAFSDKGKLREVTIPSSVELIKEYAFSDTDSLKTVTVDSGNRFYKAEEGSLLTKDGATLVKCYASEKDYVIPEGVKYIGSGAIGYDNHRVQTISLPKSLEDASSYTFTGMYNLRELTVDPANPYYAADNEALVSKDGETLIFCFSKQRDYSVKEGVEYIDSRAFDSSFNIKTINVPGTVEVIDSGTFAYIYANNINLSEGTKMICSGAISPYSNTVNVSIPASATLIERDAIFRNDYYGGAKITIFADEGTEAQDYAERYGFAFTANVHEEET